MKIERDLSYPLGMPVSITTRPFAVDPVTGIMLPDGIFDACLPDIKLVCFIKNNGDRDIHQGFVKLRREVGEPFSVVGSPYQSIGRFPAGTTLQIEWNIDLRETPVGKLTLDFEVNFQFVDEGAPPGFDGIISERVFVSHTTLDKASLEYVCAVPEGVLRVKFRDSEWTSPFTILDRERQPVNVNGIPIPTNFTAVLRSTSGQELAIPFHDPWWKVIAWIVAALAGIAAIVEASDGNGSVYLGTEGHGHDDPTDYDWCFPDGGGADKTTSAGALSAIASGAIQVGLADDIDPFGRGRDEAAFQTGEFPVLEELNVSLTYPRILEAGSSYEIGAQWHYKNTTNVGREISLSVSETRVTTHQVHHWKIRHVDECYLHEPLIVECRAELSSGDTYEADGIFAFATFTSPGPRVRSFRIPLTDDGQKFDRAPNDGWFTAGINIPQLLEQFRDFTAIGPWTISVYAQDVNRSTREMAPEAAAKLIGGVPVLLPFSLARLTVDGNSTACDPSRGLRKIVVKAS